MECGSFQRKWNADIPKKMERGFPQMTRDDCNDTCSTAANRQVKGKAKVLLSNKKTEAGHSDPAGDPAALKIRGDPRRSAAIRVPFWFFIPRRFAFRSCPR